ncbi:MAG: nickel-dependent hydrogenase large subunit [archaeon]
MKEITTIPIGPQHPALIEPEYLKVSVDGETIVDVEINLGYIHRGIERLMQDKNYIQNIYLAERICGICSGAHTVAYSQTVENLLGIDVPERAKYIRTIILELERMHSHLLWAGVAGYEIGIDTIFMSAWKDREFVMDILENISGNRVNYGMSTVGGVRRDISGDILGKIDKVMDVVSKRVDYYANVFLTDKVILARTKGIGRLTHAEALKYSPVGPTARASGIEFDIRKDNYAAYGEVEWEPVVAKEGDVQAKAVVRLNELKVAASIVKQCLKKMPDGDIKVKVAPVVHENEAVGRVEAPRGELFYYARSNGTDKPERVRIRTPTYSNLLTIKPTLVGQQLADLPIIVAAIDPCFSCTERVTLVDVSRDEEKVVDGMFFRKNGR